MDYLIVLDPDSQAAKAHAKPDGLPYYLSAYQDEVMTVCPTLRCTWLDASLPNFVRAELFPDHNGVRNIVWLPTNSVVTIFEPNHNPSVDADTSSQIH
jgi:hypothetical protein